MSKIIQIEQAGVKERNKYPPYNLWTLWADSWSPQAWFQRKRENCIIQLTANTEPEIPRLMVYSFSSLGKDFTNLKYI
jgi:hypothetical protein